MDKFFLESFMRESNRIEGELDEENGGKLWPGDVEAVEAFLEHPFSLKSLLMLHKALCKGRPYMKSDKKLWGKWRDCEVWVGGHKGADPIFIPHKMEELEETYSVINAWELHNEFETIHPFVDLNGRTGRLLYLKKALEENAYHPHLSFLHNYYYATLNNYR
ncbi:MAG: Fic family protein [Parcubacteria group bacterium]